MRKHFRKIQPAMALAARNLDRDVALETLASAAAMSPYHMHRIFSAVAGETPRQYSLRLRLGRAAAMLITRDDSILRVAMDCGFESHPGFTRAFRRHFGVTPSAYRARGFAMATTTEQAATHARSVDEVGRCITLFHLPLVRTEITNPMNYSIATKEIAPQPVLVERRRVTHTEIGPTIGEVVGRVFQYAQQEGLALTDKPFTRYYNVGPGLMTIEPGMRVASADADEWAGRLDPADGEGDNGVRRDILPGGTVAATVHSGPYEKLGDAYTALEKWMDAEGLVAAGPPWESYLNSPVDFPDPQDWKTEVCWPVK